MSTKDRSVWLCAAITAASLATAVVALTGRSAPAAPNPPPAQLFPVPFEILGGGGGAIGLQRFVVAGPDADLEQVLGHLDGRPRQKPTVVFHMSPIALCPLQGGCVPCDPRGGECTGIPPLPGPWGLEGVQGFAELAPP
jgi:hypothetical protein